MLFRSRAPSRKKTQGVGTLAHLTMIRPPDGAAFVRDIDVHLAFWRDLGRLLVQFVRRVVHREREVRRLGPGEGVPELDGRGLPLRARPRARSLRRLHEARELRAVGPALVRIDDEATPRMTRRLRSSRRGVDEAKTRMMSNDEAEGRAGHILSEPAKPASRKAEGRRADDLTAG